MKATKVAIQSIPPELLQERGEHRLHVGGKEARDGWKVLNALPADYVDYLGDLRDLSQFADASQDMVYASHILEHLGYQTDLPHVLAEVARILKPGGRLLASVPDLETLCRLFLHEELDMRARFQVMRMMFGGQVDAYDFHFVGLNDEMLASFLQNARFSQVYRVPDFGIFDDTSSMRFGGVPISLNMVAVR